METARMALAPRRDFGGVPSSSIMRLSRTRWSAASRPTTALAISVLVLATAFSTPLPRYFDLSPSRNSRASCSPVEAPEGTAARPRVPSSSKTSASTVGLPRESRIYLPRTPAILWACFAAFVVVVLVAFLVALLAMSPPAKNRDGHFNVKWAELHREHEAQRATFFCGKAA